MAGMDLPVRAIREQMASALDLIVHLTRLRDGTRRVTHVSEVMGMEGDVVVLQDIYVFDYSMGIDDEGRFLGRLKSHGHPPVVLGAALRLRHLARAGAVLEQARREGRRAAVSARSPSRSRSPRVPRSSGSRSCSPRGAGVLPGDALHVARPRGKLEQRLGPSWTLDHDREDAEEFDPHGKPDPPCGDRGDAAGGRDHRAPRRPGRSLTAPRTRSNKPTSRCGRPRRCSSTSRHWSRCWS